MSVGKIKKSDIEDIVEINPVQEGMLFYYLEDPESNRYFEQLCLELEGEIDSKKLRRLGKRSLKITRHSALFSGGAVWSSLYK